MSCPRLARRTPVTAAFIALLALSGGCGDGADDASKGKQDAGKSAADVAKRRGGGRPGGPPGKMGNWPGGQRPEGVAVRVEPLVRRDIAKIYRTSATLRAAREAPVVARAGGIVRRILVEEGDRVRSGQLMAQLEDDQALLELEQAQVDLGIAERELERARRLRAENLLSIEEFEQKRNAEAQSKTRVQIAELNVAFTKLTAPFAGTVTRRHVDRGATVNQGESVFDLVDVSRFFADVAVPEIIAARLAPGGSASLVPTSVAEPLTARIERLNPAVDPATGTVKVTLVTAPVPGLRAGGFVDVAITTDVHEDALVADAKALVADGSDWLVYSVVDGKAARVPVKTGFEDETGIEIFTEGEASLDSGSEVVVGGVAALSDGTPVRVDRPQQARTEGAAPDGEAEAASNGSPSSGSR